MDKNWKTLLNTGRVFEKIYDPVRDAKTYLSLVTPNADRNMRVGAIMTMFGVGYDIDEVIDLVVSFNRWSNFDYKSTVTEIRKLYKYAQHKVICGQTIHIAPHSNAFFDPPSLYHNFISTHSIPKENIPSNILDAAIYHWKQGRHVIPKSKDGKKPMFAWKKYQDHQPTINNILSWDWTYGLILLGTDKDCFLDIDPEGKKYVKETDFNYGLYEQTPRGGYHIYGKGKENTNKQHKGIIEIIGKGAYVVAYPTEGYKI